MAFDVAARETGGDMIKAKLCYDGGICRNGDTVEDLADALGVAVAALRQYADGKTWRHIATDALEELEKRGMIDMAERGTGREKIKR
jgi:hypothetical protein